MPLKITSVAKSTSIGLAGMPSICTRPPTRTSSNAWCTADGTPDISSTTSAPRPPVAARTAAATSCGRTTAWAPIVRARASRVSLTSEATTCDAPAARQIPTANSPIGPQPVTSTLAPGMSAVSAV
jgi:hypothetical protein